MFIFCAKMEKNRMKIQISVKILTTNRMERKALKDRQLVFNCCKNSLKFDAFLSRFIYLVS